jgi:hypothetical protein
LISQVFDVLLKSAKSEHHDNDSNGAERYQEGQVCFLLSSLSGLRAGDFGKSQPIPREFLSARHPDECQKMQFVPSLSSDAD